MTDELATLGVGSQKEGTEKHSRAENAPKNEAAAVRAERELRHHAATQQLAMAVRLGRSVDPRAW